MEPGKRHDLPAHMPEAATDWLNPLFLGTMSDSAYIDCLSEIINLLNVSYALYTLMNTSESQLI